MVNDLGSQILRKEVEEKLKDFAKQVGEKLAQQQQLIGQVVKAFEALDARMEQIENDTKNPSPIIPEPDRPGKEL